MKQTIIRSKDFNIVLDIIKTEQHNSKLTVTENPIEAGGNVADHSYINPVEIILEGSIVNSENDIDNIQAKYAIPSTIDYIVPIETKTKIVTTALQVVNLKRKLSNVRLATQQEMLDDLVIGNIAPFRVKSINKVGECLDKLNKIQEEGELVSLISNIRTYHNMAITNVKLVETNSNYGVFTINFKEVKIVETKKASGKFTSVNNLGKTVPQPQQSVLKGILG